MNRSTTHAPLALRVLSKAVLVALSVVIASAPLHAQVPAGAALAAAGGAGVGAAASAPKVNGVYDRGERPAPTQAAKAVADAAWSEADKAAAAAGKPAAASGRNPPAAPVVTPSYAKPMGRAAGAVSDRDAITTEAASMRPIAMPLSNRLVVFPYNRNYIYPIAARVERFTRISLEPDEMVTAFYLSDGVQWEYYVSKSGRDVFIKPADERITTSATLLTNKRDYELALSESANNWYQRVSWHNPANTVYERDGAARALNEGADRPALAASVAAVESRAKPAQSSTSTSIGNQLSPGGRLLTAADVSKMNFEYTVEGDAPWKPSVVFDDGVRTYVPIPVVSQELPAVFLVNAAGQTEVVSFTYQEGYLVISKVVTHGAVLKLGTVEVKLRNKRAVCGLFDSACRRTVAIN